jgi:hypothetical protein
MRIPQVTKKPNEMFPVGLKYTTPDLDEGESIVGCEVTITPNEQGGLRASGSPVIDTPIASQMIYSGLDGHEYYVNFKVTTSGGHVYQDSIFVKVRSLP